MYSLTILFICLLVSSSKKSSTVQSSSFLFNRRNSHLGEWDLCSSLKQRKCMLVLLVLYIRNLTCKSIKGTCTWNAWLAKYIHRIILRLPSFQLFEAHKTACNVRITVIRRMEKSRFGHLLNKWKFYTLNSRLLRFSQLKKTCSYFTRKFKTNHRIRTLFSVI